MASRPLRRHAQRLFLAAAVLLMALPGLLTLTAPPRALSELEGRKLAAWPERPKSVATLRAWPAAAEAWLQDHLATRDTLLGWMARLRYLLREPGETSVVFGRAGTLFYAGSARIGLAAGRAGLDEPSITALIGVLNGWSDIAAAAGAPLLVMLVPDKETMLPERLPWWARRFDSEPGLDRLVARAETEGRFQLLDLRAPLRAAEPGRAIYLDEDTHWTNYGAYLAYRALLRALADRWPGMTALEGEDLRWRSITSEQELRRMLGLPPSPDALVTDEPKPANPLGRLLTPVSESGLLRSELSGAAGPRVFFLGDSYRFALLQWLAQAFPSLVMTHVFYPDGLAELLRRYSSDLLVVELVERNLANPTVLNFVPR